MSKFGEFIWALLGPCRALGDGCRLGFAGVLEPFDHDLNAIMFVLARFKG